MGILFFSRHFLIRMRSASIVFFLAFLFHGIGTAIAESTDKPSSPVKSSSSLDPRTDNLHQQVEDIESQIQKLRQQSLELQEKTRTKLKEQLNYLQQQRDTLVPRIERLRDNSETAWADIKDNIQKAIEELKQSVEVMEK